MELNQIIAGPCSFETYEDTEATVKFLTSLGITKIRGGATKYRSNSKDYQGSSEIYDWIEGLKNTYDFEFVNEIYEPRYENVDIVQIGSRNQMNTHLLKEMNGIGLPIILKRHFASSLNSFLDHAEYLDKSNVILCLRGTMGLWPQEQRFTPDVTDIARLKDLIIERHKGVWFNGELSSPYKICYDVSHSACDVRYVKNLIKCAKIYKPDMIMIEVHPEPKRAKSDAQQQVDFDTFEKWVKEGLFND
jgi:3-deoxy-7-phosphoheptulonate synthase